MEGVEDEEEAGDGMEDAVRRQKEGSGRQEKKKPMNKEKKGRRQKELAERRKNEGCKLWKKAVKGSMKEE